MPKKSEKWRTGTPDLVEETNTMFFINKTDVSDDRWRDVTYGQIVVDYRTDGLDTSKGATTNSGATSKDGDTPNIGSTSPAETFTTTGVPTQSNKKMKYMQLPTTQESTHGRRVLPTKRPCWPMLTDHIFQ